MFAALLILIVYAGLVWLVFFKLKWLKFTIAWGFFSTFFGAHVLLIVLIGIRFVTPYTTQARVIQPTIQIVPRLTEPTLVTEVLVEPNTPVKKGQPLFRFDRRPYEFKVSQLEAQLAQAKQNVHVLKADQDVAAQRVRRLEAKVAQTTQDVQILRADVAVAEQDQAKCASELAYAQYQQRLVQRLAENGAGPEEDAQKWASQLKVAEAALKEAEAKTARARLRYTSEVGGVQTSIAEADAELKESQAEYERATLRYESEIDGVNTTVAAAHAELEQARFYLDNTTLLAPEDGQIVNLQVRPGMVAGDVRLGAIASFICDADRYLLAIYDQESLKYMKPGQAAEVALNLYPGQIFTAKVDSIWKASGEGQMLPSGTLPTFNPAPPELPQGCFAVKIVFDDEDQSKFPIGAQGASAVYTSTRGPFPALRRIVIRTYSWMNFLYPLPF